MREIKFRAWDKKRKEVFPVHELSFNKFDVKPTTAKGYTHDEKDIWNVHGGHFMNYANEDRYVLMQYTGLKDKNGVEIYESDILKDATSLLKTVTYHHGVYGCKIKRRKSFYSEELIEIFYSLFEYYECCEDIEIIGNIYENPELLEGASL